MGYKVVSTKENKVIVEVGEQTYQLTTETWEPIKGMIDGGLTDASIIAVVSNVKASDVKTYDAEKAKREVERAAKRELIAQFKADVEGHEWSAKTRKAAKALANARAALSEAEETPMVLSLADYEEVTGLVRNSGQYSFRHVTRGGERFMIVEIAPSADIHLVACRQAFEVAKTDFQVKAADELGEITPEVLKKGLRREKFDVDEAGNVQVNWDIKVGRGTGAPRKGKGTYTYEGQEYSSLTELGRVVNPTAKYPHKAASALVDKGEAVFTPSEED